MLSPGPMAPAHSESAGNCDACHLSFAGIPNTKCLRCHEGLAGRITAAQGFHSTVTSKECISCHSDHGGEDAALTRGSARTSFDHASTGYPLTGAHSRINCETCHDKPVHELGNTCASCHADPHSSALGPSCNSCHTATQWASVKTLSAHLLNMDGKHSEQACDDCHTHGENLQGDIPCANCHEDTHGGTSTACNQCHDVTSFLPAKFDHGPCTCAFPGKHQTVDCVACHEGFNFTHTPTVCSGCHNNNRPHDPLGECSTCHTATSWANSRFDHNKQSTFTIDGSHEAVACVQCHVTADFRQTPTDCASCHQPQGDQAHGSFAPFGGCERCHTVAGFSTSSFDHGSTGFALSGKHQTLGCPVCHAEKINGYPRFQRGAL